VGSEHYVNKLGQPTGQPYYGQYAQQPFIDVRVKLDNMSGQPLKATDARSYDISNF
jgi:hypothetical protein